ncbi:ThuA domain-containing protein [Sphingobacterium sp. lm-10]|uniref:ThuA domain-containing protein n=1 Tax=Sphingobacterium sp. lm-10 TaxID=2944904 RepID=UPI00201FC19D|nr:ThuA domain-containing protein [Sphingobacterium sp. lm-10]MCL7988273.1 ThuA domain-containing protein [Sphingobacterium sp. lm-10]
MMKNLSLLVLVFVSAISTSIAQDVPRVLVFSKTTGFRHDSIEKGAEAIQQLGQQHGFAVTHSEDSDVFTDDQLKQYQAVLFLSTTGDILNADQKNAFVRFIQGGKGFVGIHAASDTEYSWPWYGKMVGGYFESHPEVQHADVHVQDHVHPATAHLPEIWHHKDEWYDFKSMNPDVNILMTIDENSYQGGKMGSFHPVSWYHKYDGGRAFYTALGHTKEAYEEAEFLQHILGGISYAIGER